MLQINFNHSTWSKGHNYSVHGHTIKYDVKDKDGNSPSLPITETLLTLLHHKIIVSVYDPLFHLITGGSISGQLKLKDGQSTGKFNTITHLTIPRGFGVNRQIKLVQDTSYSENLYIPLVDESVGIGIHKTYLTDNEKRFYRNFIFVEFEPIGKTISELVADTIHLDECSHQLADPEIWTTKIMSCEWESAVWIE